MNPAFPLILAIVSIQQRPDPLAYAAQMFPPQAVCTHCRDFNRKYYRTLEVRRAFEGQRREEINTLLGITDERYQIWDALEDVQNHFLSRDKRLERLAVFRELIGEAAWRQGLVPCHVPLEYFERMER
jgi:hypothetical protein